MKRSLKFWTRHTWESTRAELIIVAILSAFTVLGAEGLDWNLFASVVPYFLIVAGLFSMILINYNNQILYVPLLISMGETRRNIFFGFQYYRALIIAVILGVSALVWALVPGQVSYIGLRSIPTILSVMVISTSMGSLMGTAFSKWRWVSVLCVFLISGVAGGIGGAAVANGIQLEQATTVELVSLLEKLPWWLAAGAVVLLVLDMCFHWVLLQKQEVKL